MPTACTVKIAYPYIAFDPFPPSYHAEREGLPPYHGTMPIQVGYGTFLACSIKSLISI
jgi:hypothetical protein